MYKEVEVLGVLFIAKRAKNPHQSWGSAMEGSPQSLPEASSEQL